jgi:hypothetical protein
MLYEYDEFIIESESKLKDLLTDKMREGWEFVHLYKFRDCHTDPVPIPFATAVVLKRELDTSLSTRPPASEATTTDSSTDYK